VDVPADEALAGTCGGGVGGPVVRREPIVRREAEAFLRELLKAGPRPVVELRQAAAEAGLSWNTIVRAKQSMRLIAGQRAGAGGSPGWEWSMAQSGDAATQKLRMAQGQPGGAGGAAGGATALFSTGVGLPDL
jgi:hypothetical protein